ncbi:hypothetical protein HMPREF9997_01962 [Corynebacterium durum F0235]|uniref:Uncharacterized protein n=1 Tax=Corynebacterium durum F0235 TaxID=1035195 RepID=L1ME10_9CORY|nr:hypothetical protein HMPREF9997_01962 [Corynebacterium durum F0235]
MKTWGNSVGAETTFRLVRVTPILRWVFPAASDKLSIYVASESFWIASCFGLN